MLNIDVQATPNADIVDLLDSYGVIPDLSGVYVSFWGLGNIAPPQEMRDPKMRDKDAAMRILRDSAAMLELYIMENPDKFVYVVGSETKGNYGRENTGSLSLERVDKVRRTLTGLLPGSVYSAADRLVSIGAGDKLPWRSEPDFF
ncbi:MAG: hypothetical protein FWH01_13215 [Oscillospiraceae bacterium]|nr:hypothetical protein [Oscillospiraceae bacterium]